MDGHTNSVISLLVVNRLMYTGSADGSAKCWVTEFGDCTRQYKGHRGSVINMKFQTGIRQYFACLNPLNCSCIYYFQKAATLIL